MVEIAISVAAKVAEYFVAPIVRPFRYIWNYKTNFQNLETAVGMLKDKQDAVQHSVDDARRNGEEIEQQANSRSMMRHLRLFEKTEKQTRNA